MRPSKPVKMAIFEDSAQAPFTFTTLGVDKLDGFATGVLGGVFQARDEIGGSDVASHTGNEQVTGSSIKNLLHRGPAVDARRADSRINPWTKQQNPSSGGNRAIAGGLASPDLNGEAIELRRAHGVCQ